jgi:hypothetical protein
MKVEQQEPSRRANDDSSRPKTMTTLMPDDCRWPIGDPQADGFHFCGKPKQGGRSYCEFHARRASTPSQPRTSVRRPKVA